MITYGKCARKWGHHYGDHSWIHGPAITPMPTWAVGGRRKVVHFTSPMTLRTVATAQLQTEFAGRRHVLGAVTISASTGRRKVTWSQVRP